MHEMSIAANILDNVLEHAAKLERVEEVHLTVGCLMMLNAEQLRFGFDMLAKGTIAEGAKVRIEITKAKLACENGHETVIEVKELVMDHLLPALRCGECGSPTRILEGRDLVLTRIVGE